MEMLKVVISKKKPLLSGKNNGQGTETSYSWRDVNWTSCHSFVHSSVALQPSVAPWPPFQFLNLLRSR
jgi:hypothetical protein